MGSCMFIKLLKKKHLKHALLLTILGTLTLHLWIHNLYFLRYAKLISARTNASKENKAEYQYAEVIERKRILLWTPHFVNSELPDYLLGDVLEFSQSEICRFNCEFTLDRKLLNSSHAVAFHGRGFNPIGRNNKTDQDIYTPLDLPTTRIASQFWIFYLWESPMMTYVPLEELANIFNITMSHRRDSDIFIPNARLVKSRNAREDAGIQNIALNKTKLIAWINSNCPADSKRDIVAAELNKHIEIDVYGACGTHNCTSDTFYFGGNSRWWHKTFKNSCYKEIGKKYKFYLAFENALCKDYITEKPFNALAVGMVPIVYGAANYSLYLPQGSYINVESFTSMKKLADYLLMLDKNPKEYLKYFEWKTHLEVDGVSFMARAWCTLCQKLTMNTLPKKEAIQDFKSWWIGENGSYCMIPNI